MENFRSGAEEGDELIITHDAANMFLFQWHCHNAASIGRYVLVHNLSEHPRTLCFQYYCANASKHLLSCLIAGYHFV
eukprot:3096759-Amphidinium_carterae.1